MDLNGIPTFTAALKHRRFISKLLLLVILSLSGSGWILVNDDFQTSGNPEVPVLSANIYDSEDHSVRSCYEAENTELNENDELLFPVLAKSHSILLKLRLATCLKVQESGLVKPRLYLFNQVLLI